MATKRTAAAKPATGKSATAKSATAKSATAKPKLLAGGNPQIAKGDGDAPVQAYIAALSDWKQDVCRRLDALISAEIPGVRKAVRWNSPFYGLPDRGWIVSYHVFTRYVKLTFFAGPKLTPVPPGGTRDDGRWIDLHEGEFDEARLRAWIRQAARLPGWGKVPPAGAAKAGK